MPISAGGDGTQSNGPHLSRILQRKRRQIAAQYHWSGPGLERGKAMSRQPMRGIGGWHINEEWLLISVAASVMVFVVGLATYFNQFVGGPPWPMQLAIAVQAPSPASSFDSVFLASNQSGLFQINNLSVGCRIISVRTKRFSVGSDTKVSLMFPARGPAPLVRPASASPFTCPFRDYVESVSGAVSLDDPTEAHVMLVAKYDAPWWWPFNSEISALFALDTRSSPPRWIRK